MAFLPEKYRRCRDYDVDVEYHHDECVGNSARLFVKYTSKFGFLGWLYHCFSCEGLPGGLVGFQRDEGGVSPREAIRLAEEARLRANPKELIQENFVLLPQDMGELDPVSRQYLLRYDLTPEEIRLASIGYSPSYERMIIPVYDTYGDGQCVLWQGRYFGADPKKPKHLTVAASGRRDGIFYYRTQGHKDYMHAAVLVESAISAIKIGRVVPTLGLLGSAIPKQSHAAVAHFLSAYQVVVVWLDPDKNLVSIKMASRLRSLYGINAISCLTTHKPKWYSTRMAEEILKGVWNGAGV